MIAKKKVIMTDGDNVPPNINGKAGCSHNEVNESRSKMKASVKFQHCVCFLINLMHLHQLRLV